MRKTVLSSTLQVNAAIDRIEPSASHSACGQSIQCFKQNAMRAMGHGVIFRVVWTLVLLNGIMTAQSETGKFVPFKDFIENVTGTDAGEYLARPASRVKDAESFEQMRQHILTMYRGVEVSHSFIRDSQHFDCVSVEQQPSVRLLGLKSIEPPPEPASLARPFNNDGLPEESTTTSTQLSPNEQFDQFGNSVRCEQNTIPMRRITLEELYHFGTLQRFFEKSPDEASHLRMPNEAIPPSAPTVAHKYAYTYQWVNNLGGNSALNLWKPYVNRKLGEVFSLSQQWYIGGSGSNEQTAEVGWQNFPAKYGSENSALFIYWTADAYRSTGCYNLDCAAFVQTNNNWYFGGRFSSYSTFGGTQQEIQIQYYFYNGNWWLALGGQWVGYYPASIYRGGQMSRNAQLIEYGGETVGSTVWPPMGSGDWANQGFAYAAYQRDIFYRDTTGNAYWAVLNAVQPSIGCFTDAGPYWSSTQGWGVYFYFGGPGGKSC